MDIAHYLTRLMSPFNSESKFYWPLTIAVGVALVAHIAWYYWPKAEPSDDAARALRGRTTPEDVIRPWAFWTNVIFLIWITVLLIARSQFIVFAVSFALNLALLAYMYFFWLPPREAAFEREIRRQRYIPRAERRKKRRR